MNPLQQRKTQSTPSFSSNVPKPRRTAHTTPSPVKRLRTRLFQLHTLLFRRSPSSRYPLRSLLPIPLLLLLALLLTPLLLLLHHTRPPSHRIWHLPFLYRHRHLDHHLPYAHLHVPRDHFRPPSYFSVDAAVREYDEAWHLLHHPHSTSSKPPRNVKTHAQIAFAIQASGDSLALLPRLLSRIHHPRNVYVIHIDAKVSASHRQNFSTFVASHPHYRPNVHIIPSEMLTYKGISSVVNSLTLMTHALQTHPDWDYYINISASDYPLLSPDNLALLLARPQVTPSLLNFVWFFPRKEWIPYSFRIRFNYWDPAAAGHQNPHNRLHYMRHQRHNPLEAHRAYVFTKAEAWAILSRPFISYLLHSTFAKRMLLSHMHVLSVSEHFLTDTLFNHPVWRTTIVPDAFRKVVWYFRGRRSGQHPYTLDRGPSPFAFWSYIVDTPCIFARKFSQPDSPLMERIDAELSGAGLNHTDARFVKFARDRRVFLQRLVEKFDNLTKTTLRHQHIDWPSSGYPPL